MPQWRPSVIDLSMSRIIPITSILLALISLAGCSGPNPEEISGDTVDQAQSKAQHDSENDPKQQDSIQDEAQIELKNQLTAPVAEKSLPEIWVERAYRAVQGKHGQHEDIGHAVWENKPAQRIVRLGTIESWSNEMTLDEFAVRVGRYMRSMSATTGNAYCGHICKGPAMRAGPWSVDILTQHDAEYCPVVPICSLPNGSGLKRFGEPTGAVMHISASAQAISSGNEAQRVANASPDGHNFVFLTLQGKTVNTDQHGYALGYYHLTDHAHKLGFGSEGRPTRYVYDYNNVFLEDARIFPMKK